MRSSRMESVPWNCRTCVQKRGDLKSRISLLSRSLDSSWRHHGVNEDHFYYVHLNGWIIRFVNYCGESALFIFGVNRIFFHKTLNNLRESSLSKNYFVTFLSSLFSNRINFLYLSLTIIAISSKWKFNWHLGHHILSQFYLTHKK